MEFRPITKGSIRGSDYVIDGAITQLDFNTYSGGGEVLVGGIGGGARAFALTAAADLRVTNTESTRIVRAGSYSKQAVGHEVYASVFRFFSSELFDIKIGDKSQEGLHAGVRWLMAEAAYDIVSSLVRQRAVATNTSRRPPRRSGLKRLPRPLRSALPWWLRCRPVRRCWPSNRQAKSCEPLRCVTQRLFFTLSVASPWGWDAVPSGPP